MAQILFPAEFSEEHRDVVLAYLTEGHTFNRHMWSRAVVAFDLLNNAAVFSAEGFLPFPLIYRQQVEDRFADAFLEQLYNTSQIEKQSTRLWAEVARQIEPVLTTAALFSLQDPMSRYLLAYCLYWWRSFTLGYTFEIEIQQDLTVAGIQFKAHDLRRRDERLSPFDLLVSEFKGDIKTSTYFLQALRSRRLDHDFYITRVQGHTRTRTLVVFVQADMWEKIDGDTLLVLLENLADNLPETTRIVHDGLEVTVIEYEIWKNKMLRYQTRE